MRITGQTDGVCWRYDLRPGERAQTFRERTLIVMHPDRAPKLVDLPGMTERELIYGRPRIRVRCGRRVISMAEYH